MADLGSFRHAPDIAHLREDQLPSHRGKTSLFWDVLWSLRRGCITGLALGIFCSLLASSRLSAWVVSPHSHWEHMLLWYFMITLHPQLMCGSFSPQRLKSNIVNGKAGISLDTFQLLFLLGDHAHCRLPNVFTEGV